VTYYHIDGSNVKDDTITYSISDRDIHLDVLQDGAYRVEYNYVTNDQGYTMLPYFTSYTYALSSYDADTGKFKVVITYGAGQEIDRVYEVWMEHDDSFEGFQWRAVEIEIDEDCIQLA